MAGFERSFQQLWRWSAGADARREWQTLPEPERRSLCADARALNCEALYYYYLTDLLPEPELREFQRSYQLQAAAALQQKCRLDELSELLTREGIRFALLKGAWLADEVYPTPALRPKGDLDILIRPEQGRQAWHRLRAAGWSPVRRNGSDDHFPMLACHQVALELHCALPRFGPDAMSRVWRELDRFRTEDCRCELPPELHLLILLQHAWGHRWGNAPRLLLDLGFLTVRRELDWDRIESWWREFGCCRPELLFAAFPELFPPTARRGTPAPPELAQLFRKLLFSPDRETKHRAEQPMHVADRFSGNWWRDRWHGLAFSRTLDQHRVGWRSLPLCYGKELARKLATFVRELHEPEDPAIRRFWREQRAVDAWLFPGPQDPGSEKP